MSNVWIRTDNEVYIRADFIVSIDRDAGGLHAECTNGARLFVTGSRCSALDRAALIDEIGHAETEGRQAVIVMKAGDTDGHPIWHHEAADALIERLRASGQ